MKTFSGAACSNAGVDGNACTAHASGKSSEIE